MNNKELAVNTIRVLSSECIDRSNSGHPGIALGAAPIAYTLFANHLVFNPKNHGFKNRDRFVLSAGHGSALYYVLLHLFGYDLSMEDLKSFRQLGSRTPGHPEAFCTPGVEVSTGPLGQGIANAVGMAIAEKRLAAKFNREGFNVVDHYTYALCGDGCLQEGIAYEAASLAGTLKLNKLIVLYDKNNITNIRYQNLYYKSMMDDTVDDSVTTQSSYVKNVSYVYDEHGKVIRENNQIVNKTFLYEYNDKGNIFQKSETAYTTGEIPETAEMICYSYGYNNNGQLVYVNYEPTGEDIIVIGNYDSYGNPHKYNGNTLTWNGQRLVGYGTNTYQYDMRGLRVSKTVNNVTTNYVYDNESRLVQETKGNQRINYL